VWYKVLLICTKQIFDNFKKFLSIKVIKIVLDSMLYETLKWPQIAPFCISSKKKSQTPSPSQELWRAQPNLIMNNTIISTEHKQLGLQLSDDGNWNKHIDMITKKAFSRVNLLRKTMNSIRLQTIPGIHQHLCHAN
jgi:hypothetical protein